MNDINDMKDNVAVNTDEGQPSCDSGCSQSGTGCSGGCPGASDNGNAYDFIEPINPNSSVKKLIGVVSGKGGVGKSLVTALSAITANRLGYKTAIMDGDITGPSIPKIFGLHEQVFSTGEYIVPATTASGIKIISTNLILENPEDPVIWRGPIIGGMVKQFWTDVEWGDIDFMFIDMPPGTGDVPLTAFQSLPIDGILIVTTPQDLVSMVVKKAINMAGMMNIPILGIIENMSYIICPSCGEQLKIFGESKADILASDNNIPLLERLPLMQEIASLCDKGDIESYSKVQMDELVNVLVNLLP